MSTVILDRQKQIVLNVSPLKYNFLMELLQSFDFVQIDRERYDGDTREAIIDNLKQAAKDIKLIKEGKLEGRNAEELLNEL
jgi:hypothetical protein